MSQDKKSPPKSQGSSAKSPNQKKASTPVAAVKPGAEKAAKTADTRAEPIAAKKSPANVTHTSGAPAEASKTSGVSSPKSASKPRASLAAKPERPGASANPSKTEQSADAGMKAVGPVAELEPLKPVMTSPELARSPMDAPDLLNAGPASRPESVADASKKPGVDAPGPEAVAATPLAVASDPTLRVEPVQPGHPVERRALPHEPAQEAPHAPEWAPPPHHPVRNPLFIVHISSELAPVAKVGGLADVVFGLCREMEQRGNHVEIILPKYDCLRYDHIWDLQCAYEDLWVPWSGAAIHCSVYSGSVHGRKCYFIEPHSQDNYFNRGVVYGFNDDVMRFAFFSRAAMEFLWKAGKHPDIIHCHDWQTALVPVMLYEIYQPMGMMHPRVCFTIHNFKHQGATGGGVLNATGLNRPEYYFHYDRLRDNNNPQAINLMKGGIVYSNFVTTVSPRYASEAKDQGQAFGLEPTLHIHHSKYGGVVNGVDYEVWNPEIDPLLSVNYSVDSLDLKYENKRALRHRLMLADNEKPIIAFVGRLDPQKGIELIRHALFYTLAQGGQFVLLGSSPDHSLNAYFVGLKHQFNDNPDAHLEIGYNEELAHLIYAGADITVVPSRFEPCGLIQLIAMRYGTIPVVREVGGLADTVIDKDFSNHALNERNGYVFRDYNEAGLESALGRAIACYYQYPEHFRALMKNAMRYDYSWNHPGQDYLNIYDFIREQ